MGTLRIGTLEEHPTRALATSRVQKRLLYIEDSKDGVVVYFKFIQLFFVSCIKRMNQGRLKLSSKVNLKLVRSKWPVIESDRFELVAFFN